MPTSKAVPRAVRPVLAVLKLWRLCRQIVVRGVPEGADEPFCRHGLGQGVKVGVEGGGRVAMLTRLFVLTGLHGVRGHTTTTTTRGGEELIEWRLDRSQPRSGSKQFKTLIQGSSSSRVGVEALRLGREVGAS